MSFNVWVAFVSKDSLMQLHVNFMLVYLQLLAFFRAYYLRQCITDYILSDQRDVLVSEVLEVLHFVSQRVVVDSYLPCCLLELICELFKRCNLSLRIVQALAVSFEKIYFFFEAFYDSFNFDDLDVDDVELFEPII